MKPYLTRDVVDVVTTGIADGNTLAWSSASSAFYPAAGGTPLSSASPAAIGISLPGTSASAAHGDHVHAHGSQSGGPAHATATSASAGSMSAADKTKLDLLTLPLATSLTGGGTLALGGYTLTVAGTASISGTNTGDNSANTSSIANSLLTTRGDLIRRGASVTERLALAPAYAVLTSDGTDVVWSTGYLSVTTGKTLVATNTLTLAGATDGYTLTVPATGTAALATGVVGGQTIYGGTAASNSLTLDSTTSGTKGYVLIQPSGGHVGIGTSTPTAGAGFNPILDISGAAPCITFHDTTAAEDDFSMYVNSSTFEIDKDTGSGLTTLLTLSSAGAFKLTGAFGCNNATPQAPYAKGTLTAYTTGSVGYANATIASQLHAAVVAIRSALVLNGIMV